MLNHWEQVLRLTWHLSSSLSGRLYLRIGFRNTALCGISIVIAAITLFLFLPFPGPVWILVSLQMLLGAGFGLMSTPVLVGVQSLVPWNKRGVVTGANMFQDTLVKVQVQQYLQQSLIRCLIQN